MQADRHAAIGAELMGKCWIASSREPAGQSSSEQDPADPCFELAFSHDLDCVAGPLQLARSPVGGAGMVESAKRLICADDQHG